MDPPVDLAYESEVSVIVDDGAFLDMAGHETGLRFRPLPTKMCVLVHTDSALQNADADPDEEGTDGASVLEDRRTALTVGVSARKVFGRSGKRPETFRTDVGADTSAVGRRTDEIICGCLLES